MPIRDQWRWMVVAGVNYCAFALVINCDNLDNFLGISTRNWFVTTCNQKKRNEKLMPFWIKWIDVLFFAQIQCVAWNLVKFYFSFSFSHYFCLFLTQPYYTVFKMHISIIKYFVVPDKRLIIFDSKWFLFRIQFVLVIMRLDWFTVQILWFFLLLSISLSEWIWLSQCSSHWNGDFVLFWTSICEKEEEEDGKKHRIYDSILDLESYLVVTSCLYWKSSIGLMSVEKRLKQKKN